MESRDIKCTNSERTTASQVLADAMSVGQLSVTEFEERSSRCADATTRGELVDLVSDLIEAPEQVLFGSHQVARQRSKEVKTANQGTATAVDQALAQVEPSVHGAQGLSRPFRF